jgi:RNA polymerase sigma factor (TIGR02999 family)
MAEITELLSAARDGDDEKLGHVFEALYPELKRLASSRARAQPGSAVTTTALVHETFLKLTQAGDLDLQDRLHFFRCSAKAMRHILIDQLRAAIAGKRGGGVRPVSLPADLAGDGLAEWLDLDRGLDDLDEVDPVLREVVELRFFAGLTEDEVAELMDCSTRTVQRKWRRARAFLYARLEAEDR